MGPRRNVFVETLFQVRIKKRQQFAPSVLR